MSMLVWFVLVLTKHFLCSRNIVWRDIEKCADSLAHEDDPAAVCVGSDIIFDACLREYFLERQRLFQALGDIDQS